MMLYLLQVILCSGLLLLVHAFLLKRARLHHFNRFYLLAAIVCSFLIPLLSINLPYAVPKVAEIQYVGQAVWQTIVPQAATTAAPVKADISLVPVLLMIFYLAITSFLLVRFIRNLYIMWVNIKHHVRVPYSRATLVLTSQGVVPHSFLRYIFIDQEEFINGRTEKEILLHECTHVQQKHSLDVLFVELLQVLMWFNPFLFFYNNAIRINHEFLADEAVVKKYNNTWQYQQLLISKASLGGSSALASSISYSLTKKRLIMMTKTTSRINAFIRQLALIPVLAGIVMAFAIKTTAQEKEPVVHPKMKQVQSTVDGIAQPLLDEYRELAAKNTIVDSKGKMSFLFSKEDRARLETLYKQMSREQQLKQSIMFAEQAGLLPRVIPTEKQFISFKRVDVYGVWVDGKKIPNQQLNDYQASDFEQVFISKLYGAAKAGKKYSYQVDLMTKDHYRKYEAAHKADTSLAMFYREFRRGRKDTPHAGKDVEIRRFIP